MNLSITSANSSAISLSLHRFAKPALFLLQPTTRYSTQANEDDRPLPLHGLLAAADPEVSDVCSLEWERLGLVEGCW